MASQTKEENETPQETYQKFTNLITTTFPRSCGLSTIHLYRHPEGFYASLPAMLGIMASQLHLKSRPSDIFLSTLPKSGTTWLKALIFAITNRKSNPNSSLNAFNTLSPHECIPFLEYQLYTNNRIPDLDALPSPRLFATHTPFRSLPESIITSGCKIVYVCRDPKDSFVSLWHFVNRLRKVDKTEPMPIEKAFDHFCDGVSPLGPYWDHILGYWRAHLQRPEQVLFLKYEEMKEAPLSHVRRLAEFVGWGFNDEEERDGVCEEVVRLCSFESLKNLESNKKGKTWLVVGSMENNLFFRRGVVGDWNNYLTPEMAKRIDEISKIKFEGSGLSF